jgi:hypothetical protein
VGLIATALVCLAAACSGPHAAAAPRPQPFAIHFEKSGGLKPMPQELTIGPGRHAKATMATGTPAGARTVRFRVSKKQVARLRRGLRQAHFSELESSLPGNCADCYLYTIEYRGHEVTADDSALPDRLHVVVRKLETIVFTHVVMPSPGEVPGLP